MKGTFTSTPVENLVSYWEFMVMSKAINLKRALSSREINITNIYIKVPIQGKPKTSNWQKIPLSITSTHVPFLYLFDHKIRMILGLSVCPHNWSKVKRIQEDLRLSEYLKNICEGNSQSRREATEETSKILLNIP